MEASTYSQDCARGLGHPDSSAARKARIAAWQQVTADRAAKLEKARSLIRSAGVRDSAELLALLQCVQANCGGNSTTDFVEQQAALLELCTDIDAEVSA
jgi:hypothetical protein